LMYLINSIKYKIYWSLKKSNFIGE
jgi:hypothetical protein